MRSRFFRRFALVLVCSVAGPAGAFAQPKHKSAQSPEVSDKNMDKQMAWESKVMGEDSAKKADMKKIAAAQKLADEARKHPPAEPAPKVKDPNKEGVRAKQEAAIGLPIASEQEAEATRQARKLPSSKRAAATPANSADDELGALVASSLASEKASERASEQQSPATHKGHGGKARGKSAAKASGNPSALDRMFAN